MKSPGDKYSMKLAIKVAPRSSEQKLIMDKNSELKCYINSPPEDGKANKELITLLSKLLKTTQRDIQIIEGLTSRTKVLEIAGFATEKELFQVLGFQVQNSLL
jgi:hypothetical protein